VVVPSGCDGGEVVNFERDGSDLGERRGRRRLHFECRQFSTYALQALECAKIVPHVGNTRHRSLQVVIQIQDPCTTCCCRRDMLHGPGQRMERSSDGVRSFSSNRQIGNILVARRRTENGHFKNV